MEQNTMHRRTFFLAGPLGALVATVKPCTPDLLETHYHPDEAAEIMALYYKMRAKTAEEAERAAAKLALVRK